MQRGKSLFYQLIFLHKNRALEADKRGQTNFCLGINRSFSININHSKKFLLNFSECHKTDAGNKIEDSWFIYNSNVLKLSIETLIEEIKLSIMEKLMFECLEQLSWIIFFGTFGLSGYQCSEQNQPFLNPLVQQKKRFCIDTWKKKVSQ